MKKRRLVIHVFLIILAAIAFAACGSSSDGGFYPAADGTFVKELNGPGLSGWTWPFSTTGEARFQSLLLAGEISGSGYIHSISFKRQASSLDTTCPSYVIKMGHTTITDISTTYNNNVEQGAGSMSNVVDGTTVTVPAGSAGEFFDIALGTPFYYNGQDNLVVELVRTHVCDNSIAMTSSAVSPVYDGLLTSQTAAASTGSIVAKRLDVKLHFRGGVDRLEYGPVGGTGNIAPLNGSKVQLLYDPAFINGSGYLTGLAMRIGDDGGSYTESVNSEMIYTMKLAHTAETSLTYDFAANLVNSTDITVVASAAVINIPAGVQPGEYIWIPMPEGMFKYDGVSNLLLELDVSSSSQVNKWAGTHIPPEKTRAFGDTGSDSATFLDSYRYHIAFRFKGGTMDVMPSVSNAQTFPFGSVEGKVQQLYFATDLGTKGIIDSFKCRSAYDISIATQFSYIVTLAHSTATDLTTVFDDNLESDAEVVFNGTFGLPDALAGDWVEIPFTSGFNYNGKDNLVLEIKGTGGASTTLNCLRNYGGITYYTGLWGGSDQNAVNGAQMPARLISRFGIK